MRLSAKFVNMSVKLEIHKQSIKEELANYYQLIKPAKTDCHKSQLENCNSCELFAKVNSLCKPKAAKVLPTDSSDVPLVERFSHFFCQQD